MEGETKQDGQKDENLKQFFCDDKNKDKSV